MVFPLPQGITRVKSSSDVVGALIKELRLQSGQPESDFRLAVAVDGVNALWGRSTIRKEDKSPVRNHVHNLVMPHTCLHAFSTYRMSYVSVFLAVYQVDPEELTVIHNLRKLMKNDWVKAMTIVV